MGLEAAQLELALGVRFRLYLTHWTEAFSREVISGESIDVRSNSGTCDGLAFRIHDTPGDVGSAFQSERELLVGVQFDVLFFIEESPCRTRWCPGRLQRRFPEKWSLPRRKTRISRAGRVVGIRLW